MRYLSIIVSLLLPLTATALPPTALGARLPFSTLEIPKVPAAQPEWNSNISLPLFAELEELARIVDISYCVGTTGISKPFQCASRCNEFPTFELVDTFNTGPMMSDSCGYIVLDHGSTRPAIEEGAKELKELWWARHRLQRGLLRHGEEINEDDTMEADALLSQLERREDLDVVALKTTKIHKVVEAIMNVQAIPRDDKFMIKERSRALSEKWRDIITSGHQSPVTTSAVLKPARIIVAFRGTYSIANTIVDLSTVPQEYVPYPDDPDEGGNPDQHRFWDMLPRPLSWLRSEPEKKDEKVKCNNCTVHSGFWTSWQNTRDFILPHLKLLHEEYPDYQINLVGHSLGGAVAALAGLEFQALGWYPIVTTFGEPRVGNSGLRNYIDATFHLPSEHAPANSSTPSGEPRYRRLTHVDDPVPLLPLQEWGYRPHAGEVFISKASLQPSLSDIVNCYGDEDLNCIAGAEVDESWSKKHTSAIVEDYLALESTTSLEQEYEVQGELRKRWGIPIPARYKMWQLFFAHRDYFWRLGLCIPGGDPMDWGRERYDFDDQNGEKNEKEEM